MENKINLFSKDKIWIRIKKYIYFVVVLIIIIILLLFSNLILNCMIYKNLNQINLNSHPL